MTAINRRNALSRIGALCQAPAFLKAAPAVRIEKIEPRGILIRDCTLPGETRADNVTPAHPNGIQVSNNRWLLVYATRGFRGVDDDLSIVYQLRANSFEGPVLKEGFLARTQSDWDPLGDGNRDHVKQHGHPVAFGVPRGARIGGKPAPSANVFVAKRRKKARNLDRARNYLTGRTTDLDIDRLTQTVEWVQFRLNAAEDDIEILRQPAKLRQKGYESGDKFCEAPIHFINQSFVQAVPFNSNCTEWVDCEHFDRGHLACLKYRFNPRAGLYEWTEMGPLLDSGKKAGLIEASVAHWHGDWIISGRREPGGGVTWFRTNDPFSKAAPAPVDLDTPPVNSPLTAYTWADGVLRLFAGDPSVSPYKIGRDPLYCWDIDPDRGFAASNRRVIFDTFEANLPIRAESGPKVDMCKPRPLTGKRSSLPTVSPFALSDHLRRRP